MNLRTRHITSGADGNLWFTSDDQNNVATISPSGSISVVDSGATSVAGDVTSGPGGALFVVRPTQHRVERMTTSGVVEKSFELPDTAAWLDLDLAVGPDDTVWVTGGGSTAGTVSRIAGDVITTFPNPDVPQPRGIIAGSDGNMWVTGSNATVKVSPAGIATKVVDRGWPAITTGADGNLWFPDLTRVARMTPTGTIATYRGTPIVGPNQMVTAGDGSMFFTDEGTISRITTAGVLTPDVGGQHGVSLLAGGTGGDVWFAATSATESRFGHVTATGQVTELTRTDVQHVLDLILGPEGNLWFTTYNQGIGTLTPEGVLTMRGGDGIHSLTVGPDGNIWFPAYRSLVRVTPAGVGTAFDLHDDTSGFLMAGPDGKMWVTTTHFGYPFITRVSTTGSVERSFALPNGPVLRDMAAGPDGNLWFLQQDGVFRLTPDGTVTTWVDPGMITSLSIVAGSDGALWYTDLSNASISRVDTGVPVASRFHAVGPTRILDSRTATGGWQQRLDASTPRVLQVTGGGVPDEATAVVMNVTVTDSTTNSFLTVHPAGTTASTASNVNFAAGQTIPNLVTVAVGAGGKVTFTTAVGAVHVIADLVGYYVPWLDGGDGYHPMAATRLYDSRTQVGPAKTPLGTTPREIAVHGVAGIPATATSIVANVTVTEPSTSSFVTMWAAGAPRPATSNLNFAKGQTTANLAVIPIGAAGGIAAVTAYGSVELVVDVVGWFDSTGGGLFHALAPQRLLDGRVGKGLNGPWQPGQTRLVKIATAGDIPAGATATVMNTTVTNGTAGSFVTVFSAGPNPPTTSSINFAAGQTIANLTMPGLDGPGTVKIFNQQGTVDVVGDVVGYFTPG
jgi:streptogramin lyase